MHCNHSPTSLAREYRDFTVEQLQEEVRCLKEKVKVADVAADKSRQQVSVINRNLVVMHDRERRLEDVVLQLSFELGGRGQAPPKPREYSMAPEEAVDHFLISAIKAYEKDRRVYELKCEMLQEEIQDARDRLEKCPPTMVAPKEFEDKATMTEAMMSEDDEAREARYRAKSQRLERAIQTLREQQVSAATSPKGRPAVNEALENQKAALEKELNDLKVSLEHERQRVKEKVHKNLELKMKIADIVERAQERDGRRKQRIQALQALLAENGVNEEPESMLVDAS